jgi:hypothetical protein
MVQEIDQRPVDTIAGQQLFKGLSKEYNFQHFSDIMEL